MLVQVANLGYPPATTVTASAFHGTHRGPIGLSASRQMCTYLRPISISCRHHSQDVILHRIIVSVVTSTWSNLVTRRDVACLMNLEAVQILLWNVVRLSTLFTYHRESFPKCRP